MLTAAYFYDAPLNVDHIIGMVTNIEPIRRQHNKPQIRIVGQTAHLYVDAFGDDFIGNTNDVFLKVLGFGAVFEKNATDEAILATLVGQCVLTISTVTNTPDILHILDQTADGLLQITTGGANRSSDVLEYTLYSLETRDNGVFYIIGLHAHDGFYKGESVLYLVPYPNHQPTPNKQARLIVVVGLPASGKTTYCNDQYSADEYYHMDDALSCKYGYRYALENALQSGHQIVFNDPRLCQLKTFKTLLVFARRHVETEAQIEIVYFENNCSQCCANVTKDNKALGVFARNKLPNIYALCEDYDKTIACIERLRIIATKLPVFCENVRPVLK